MVQRHGNNTHHFVCCMIQYVGNFSSVNVTQMEICNAGMTVSYKCWYCYIETGMELHARRFVHN